MENKSSSSVRTQVAAGLGALEDVTALAMQAGQVLVYEGHLAQGLWVVLSGRLRLDGPGLPEPLEVEAGPPFVVPPPAELDCPSDLTVSVAADAQLLFVPRSVALASTAVARLVEEGLLADRSLRTPCAAPDQRGPA